MPTWLISHLERTGQLNADGIHRTASRGRCARCRSPLLIGLDSEPCGLVARIDPWPIDRMAEFLAVATGRWTYNLVRSATSSGKRCWNIDRRCDYHISAAWKWVVVAEHRCGAPLPETDVTSLLAMPVTIDTREEAPF